MNCLLNNNCSTTVGLEIIMIINLYLMYVNSVIIHFDLHKPRLLMSAYLLFSYSKKCRMSGRCIYFY